MSSTQTDYGTEAGTVLAVLDEVRSRVPAIADLSALWLGLTDLCAAVGISPLALDQYNLSQEGLACQFLYLGLPAALRARPIEHLWLSTRVFNILKRTGIDTIEDLLEWAETEILAIRQFGTDSMIELKARLSGLHLSRHDQPGGLLPPGNDRWVTITFDVYRGKTRQVLHSRLGRVTISQLAPELGTDFSILNSVMRQLRINRVEELHSTPVSRLRELDWNFLVGRLNLTAESDPADHALERLQAILGRYDLHLPDA